MIQSRRSILGAAGAAALSSLLPWRPKPADIVLASEADVPDEAPAFRMPDWYVGHIHAPQGQVTRIRGGRYGRVVVDGVLIGEDDIHIESLILKPNSIVTQECGIRGSVPYRMYSIRASGF